ncbi:MAG: hypothetical protein GC201_17615 [Alphaproteobacteria bacterium]|nr:hypothetical protein [Alphaproteobacteria bacterium]
MQRNGRRGQDQDGVDLFGIRDDNRDWHVGIQCKLRGEGRRLTKKEVREEVEKATNFKPPLKEYYITTTAPDDVALQELARELTVQLARKGIQMRVFVWGWNTLEERISESSSALKAFDPTHTLFGDEILNEVQNISHNVNKNNSELSNIIATLSAQFTEVVGRLPLKAGDSTVASNALEVHLDAEIDEYRELNSAGKTYTSLALLEKLLERVGPTASGRILFRIKANIGHCLLSLGREDEAAATLLASYAHAPEEPKAVANRALGLLLQGAWQEVLVFGRQHLQADPTNEWLAGYLLQAARFDSMISDPLEMIPEQLHRTAPVLLGRAVYCRQRGEPGEWWPIARELLEKHPSEPYAARLAAEANLDEILASQKFQRTHRLSADERERIEAVTALLRSQWDRQRSAEGPIRPEDAALCGNVIVGLLALDNLQDALEVVGQGLALAPDDSQLLLRSALVAIEAGADSLARELIDKLPKSPDSIILKVRFYASHALWAEIVSLVEENAQLIPEVEAPIVLTTGKLADISANTKEPEERRRQISVVAQEAADDPRASIIVADFARRQGLEDIAEQAYHKALSHIVDASHIADRLMVAQHASHRGDAAVVANLLDGHVAEDYDNRDLRMLASAFVNDIPIRRRAMAFFERLSDNIRDLPFFLHAEGLLHLNRGALFDAEATLKRAVASEGTLENFLALFTVLHRLDRVDEVREIIEGINLQIVDGTPTQKMILAQIMRRVGLDEQALRYGYEVLQSARNDQEVALRYFGLIMAQPDNGVIPSAERVAVDTWVRLETGGQGAHTFVIEDGKDRPADDILSPSHPTVAAAMGRRVGDEFEMPMGFGGSRRWRVAEIKHKYVHALHDVMENFDKRFPDAAGFYKIEMKDEDIQPALDEVRRLEENNRKLAELYLNKSCPLSFVVSQSGGDTIRFAEYIRFLDHDIRACIGTGTERAIARNYLQQHQGGGAVLDAYTAWTVATLDAFEELRAVFGFLIIPQSCIDEIKSLKDGQEIAGESMMTIGWHNGEYIRQEYTLEDIALRNEYISKNIKHIEGACDVQPVVIPDDPSEAAILISQSLGSNILDAPNLAGMKYLLVSEDFHFRQFGEMSCGARGVWLQEVFSFGFDIGVIDHRRYVELVVKLARFRHGHLTLHADTLLVALRDDPEEKLEGLKALARFLFNQNADLHSHVRVAAHFLNLLWEEYGRFDLRCLQATSIVLERIVRYRSGPWAAVLAAIKLACTPMVRSYIDNWVIGHCLPAHDVASAERLFREASRQNLADRVSNLVNQSEGTVRAQPPRS